MGTRHRDVLVCRCRTVPTTSAANFIECLLAWLLLISAVAMVGVAIHLIRVRATGSRDRLRQRFEQMRERNQPR